MGQSACQGSYGFHFLILHELRLVLFVFSDITEYGDNGSWARFLIFDKRHTCALLPATSSVRKNYAGYHVGNDAFLYKCLIPVKVLECQFLAILVDNVESCLEEGFASKFLSLDSQG